MKTILLFGLGNPGKEYAKTRHNAGFMFVDYFWQNFRDEFGFSDWKFNKKIKSEISIGKMKGRENIHLKLFPIGESLRSVGKIILLKPQTFMNLSGEAVVAAKKYYKAKLEDIVVAHDDIDLQLGKFKFSKNSSSAGHNGAQNTIDALGTKNFTRLRIGVDSRGDRKIPTEKYVLGKFTIVEEKIIKNTIEKSSGELIIFKKNK